ncbi:hypothetical protein DICSQDRAFT_176507 [Dichomitus squalens LYAD-421 SS1]|uniref:Uncharacterized protein n=1 Tax=Dichomitus squalens TaxID=114155 RepID=A0A4Q9N7T4_9APHY|nr:uncharacterized protein DICSQDRAFT_176507 [Dichomitus squalens LYAD-421 SS1]EJF66726.1 hypothetical protein DICSQDRAFT_176507 [Dichomitus squalens LYAD-421 SS1]TBU35281.1 hypothetical protein BD311DRAFT_801938 [Dichomitus squalens]
MTTEDSVQLPSEPLPNTDGTDVSDSSATIPGIIDIVEETETLKLASTVANAVAPAAAAVAFIAVAVGNVPDLGGTALLDQTEDVAPVDELSLNPSGSESLARNGDDALSDGEDDSEDEFVPRGKGKKPTDTPHATHTRPKAVGKDKTKDEGAEEDAKQKQNGKKKDSKKQASKKVQKATAI